MTTLQIILLFISIFTNMIGIFIAGELFEYGDDMIDITLFNYDLNLFGKIYSLILVLIAFPIVTVITIIIKFFKFLMTL